MAVVIMEVKVGCDLGQGSRPKKHRRERANAYLLLLVLLFRLLRPYSAHRE